MMKTIPAMFALNARRMIGCVKPSAMIPHTEINASTE